MIFSTGDSKNSGLWGCFITSKGAGLSERLLDILACPKCKNKFEYDKTANKLICNICRLKYRVEDSIPVLIIDEAEKF